MYLAFPYLPREDFLLQDLVTREFQEVKIFSLEETGWQEFLARIEEYSSLLSSFFRFYTKLVPTGIRLHLKTKNRRSSPLYKEVMIAKDHLYEIAQTLKGIKTLYAEYSGRREEEFSEVLWRQIAILTRNIVWKRTKLNSFKANPASLHEARHTGYSYVQPLKIPQFISLMRNNLSLFMRIINSEKDL